jgi:hypothetical protein
MNMLKAGALGVVGALSPFLLDGAVKAERLPTIPMTPPENSTLVQNPRVTSSRLAEPPSLLLAQQNVATTPTREASPANKPTGNGSQPTGNGSQPTGDGNQPTMSGGEIFLRSLEQTIKGQNDLSDKLIKFKRNMPGSSSPRSN